MRSLLLPLLLVLPGAAPAHEFQAGDLTIGHPFAYESAGASGGGYLSVANAGAEADALVGVETPLGAAGLHVSAVSDEGMATMTPVERFEIPAGGTLTLEPGAGHIMLMGLADPLEEGETFPATLVFERAGRVEVEFHVEARGGDASADDHEGMDHGAMDNGAMDHGADDTGG